MEFNIDELRTREFICRVFIAELESVDDSEPRKASALAECRRQLDLIRQRIAEAEASLRSTGTQPPDVVVRVKPASLSGKTSS